MLERPPGPMHETIRRALDEMRLYSNNYGAIKLITATLQQADSPAPVVAGAGSENGAAVGTPKREGSAGRAPSPSLPAPQRRAGGVVQGVVLPNAARALNATQRVRLLLLRADAYSATRQHERALEDASAALHLTRGHSAEAHFAVGRELLRLHRVGDAAAAFERGEALLRSPPPEAEAAEGDEADFWAMRGVRARDGAGVGERPQPTRLADAEETAAVGADAAHWRRLAEEARALARVRASRVAPLSVLGTALALLEHRAGGVRGALVVCVENTTGVTLRLLRCTSPNGEFHGGMRFPETIPPAHCGLAVMQPAGWGGFVGGACYELGERGVACYVCFESSFMGSVKCGVRFASERRSVEAAAEMGDVLNNSNHSISNSSSVSNHSIVHNSSSITNNNNNNSGGGGLSALAAGGALLSGGKLPNPSLWIPSHTAPMPSGRRIKVTGATRGGGRTVLFAVAEVQALRLRAVELLTALEFAGPALLKRLSAVSCRYRELVNHLPPSIFYGAGWRSYPDYCVRLDRVSSPWVVRDREAVRWSVLFDSRSGSRENLTVVSAEDPQSAILTISGDSTGTAEATVCHGDRRSPLAHVKSSWVPFSSTLYLCTPAGRSFASCAANPQSHFALSWEGGGGKGKAADAEYVMRPKEPPWRGDAAGKAVAVSPLVASGRGGDGGNGAATFTLDGSISSTPAARAVLPMARNPRNEAFTVWRPVQVSGGAVGRGAPNQTNNGMELVAEVSVSSPGSYNLVKGTTVCEMKMFTGVDALLLTLLVYCKSQWGT